MLRTRWAAIGAAVAVTLGAGGIGLVSATSPSDAVTFVPIEPCRLFDTRPDFQVGPRSSPLGPDETFTTQATGDNGQCTGIPATATGLGMNVTAVGPSQATVLTIWGAGARPNASSLNPTPGQPPTPNAVTSGLTGAGQLNVWNAFGSVHVLVDIVGYYTDHNHDDRYYTEAEVDGALGGKANVGDSYTKAESDGRYDNAHADIDGENLDQNIGGAAVTFATVEVETPTSGYIVANASATLHGAGALGAVNCSITSGSTLDANAQFTAYAATNQKQTISGTRGFTENKALELIGNTDTRTINFVCQGIGGAPNIEDPQLNAIFVPDPDTFGFIIIGP